jgi:hypothetical protein
VVGPIGIDASLNGPGRHAYRFASRGCLDRFEVPAVDGARAYECFDLGDDLGFEGRFEAPFLAASCEAASGAFNSASAHCSQACQ